MKQPIDETLDDLKRLQIEIVKGKLNLSTSIVYLIQILIRYFEWKQRSYMERMSPKGTQPIDRFAIKNETSNQISNNGT